MGHFMSDFVVDFKNVIKCEFDMQFLRFQDSLIQVDRYWSCMLQIWLPSELTFLERLWTNSVETSSNLQHKDGTHVELYKLVKDP